MEKLTPELRDYLTCALWSSTDLDSDTPLDRDYGLEDVSEESVTQAESDLHQFAAKAGTLLDGLDMTQVAHDLWLTRNGHGEGFWDGDYEESIGEALTQIAHDMGEVYVYVGDDGKLHFD